MFSHQAVKFTDNWGFHEKLESAKSKHIISIKYISKANHINARQTYCENGANNSVNM